MPALSGGAGAGAGAGDKEGLRRPPGDPPTASSPPEVLARHRSAVSDFPAADVPPLMTAHWPLKPASLIRGTWREPKEAGEWLALRLAEFAPRFAAAGERADIRLSLLVRAAVERLADGGDVSLGHYLNRTVFHSVALVTCSPNAAVAGLTCPARRAGEQCSPAS